MNQKYNRSYGYTPRPQLEEKQTSTTPSSLKLISICTNGERSASAPTPGNEEQNDSRTYHTSKGGGGSKKRPLTTGNNSLVLVSKFGNAGSNVDETSLSSSSSHLYYKSVGSRPSRHRHSYPHYKEKKSSFVTYSNQPRRFPVRDRSINKTWKRPVDETNDETLLESHHVKNTWASYVQ